MTKKDIWLLALLITLVLIYVFVFTNWFKQKPIIISDTSRPMQHFRGRQNLPDIYFALGKKYSLTDIKIVPLANFQADSGTPAVWHLVSDSNSVPVQLFVYGQRIRGMRPAFAGGQAEDLETNVIYRLFVTAGREKGFHDFKIK
jgi:hypothetical protein